MGVGHVIIETDAIEVVRAVYSDAFDLSPMTFLVIELRSVRSSILSPGESSSDLVTA